MNENHPDIACDSPVTIIIKRRPKPDHEKEFEEIMAGTTKDALKFEGHLGVNILRPTSPVDFYRIVFKFDSLSNYMAWENSEIRQLWLKRYEEVTLGEHEMEILSGLETWFTLPGGEAVVPPPKYKMAIVIWISIFPLSILINYVLSPLISEFHLVTRSAIISVILVILMTYAVMPLVSQLFHRWLHCQK